MSGIYDVGVVGAGVMGSATAYFLKKHNPDLNILLLEQFDFLHRKGSSHGDSRIIRMTYSKEHYTQLMGKSYKLWQEVEEEAGTKIFTKTGGLDFGQEDNPELLNLMKVAQKYGVEMEVLKPPEVSKRFPNITIPQGWIAVYSPTSGILNATKAVAVFQSLAKERGCVLRDNAKVLKVSKKDEVYELETQQEVFKVRKVVFTTGPWTRLLLKSNLGLDLPLQVEQTTIAYWKVEESSNFHSGNFPVFINYDEPLIYGTPAHEFPGLIKCAAHYGKRLEDPEIRDYQPGQEAIEKEVAPFLKKFFKGVDPIPVRTESCLYTWTPDYDFIIDKVPDQDGRLFVGCGFSGHGFKLSPVVGHMLAELVVKGHSPSYTKTQHLFSISRLKKENSSKL